MFLDMLLILTSVLMVWLICSFSTLIMINDDGDFPEWCLLMHTGFMFASDSVCAMSFVVVVCGTPAMQSHGRVSE